MKPLCFVFSLLFVFNVFGQERRKPKKADWRDWSDSVAFFNGEEPLMKGFGTLSDTLSSLHSGKIFFECNEKYYVINSLKDYYYWFTQKHPFLFKDSVKHYAYFYVTGDDFGMARFVKENFTGRRLPVKYKFTISRHPTYNSDGYQNLHQMPSINYTPSGSKYIQRN